MREGLVRHIEAMPTSPEADPVPSKTAAKQEGSGRFCPCREETLLLPPEVIKLSGVLFLGVTNPDLGVVFLGVIRGVPGDVRDFSL